MLKISILCIGFITIAVTVKFLINEIILYKTGIKREAILVSMKPYNHMEINEDKNKVYDVGIDPILEICNGCKKVLVEYDDYDEFKDLNIGDKVKVIYPKENINKIKRYSIFNIFKNSIFLSLIAVFIFFIAFSLK